MWRLSRWAVVAVLIAWTFVTRAQASFVATGVYDENTVQTNVVDVSATTDGANTLSLASFTTLVAAAFAADAGGVINFDNGTLAGPNTIDATYGVSQGLSLSIGNGSSRTWALAFPALSTAISGSGLTPVLSKTGSPQAFSTWNDFIFTFDPNDKVTAVGATILNKFAIVGTPVGNVSGRVRYTDASFATSVFSQVSTGSGSGTDDTFWGFRAPAGLFIDRFELTVTDDDASAYLDDLAFVTIVPEAGAWRFVGVVAAGAWAVTRFRRSSSPISNERG